MERIKFKNVAGIMLIPARADGVDGWFALDTGAMQTSLNRVYFPDIEGSAAEVAVFDSGMSVAKASSVTIREFTVGGRTLNDLPVILTDMTYVEKSLRAVEPEICFYGSVGVDSFGERPFLIDYESSEITVEPNIDVSRADRIPLCRGAFTVIEVEISGKSRRFVFDTGANTCLISAELLDETEAVPADEQGIYTIPRITVGSHEYRDVTAVFSDISRIRGKTEGVDGLIGSQILSKQPSLVDLKGGALYLF